MLELTREECLELQKRVVDKMYPADSDKEISRSMALIAAKATIATIREYERMKLQKQDHPQSAE